MIKIKHIHTAISWCIGRRIYWRRKWNVGVVLVFLFLRCEMNANKLNDLEIECNRYCLHTGSCVMVRIDWAWWITVCFAMDWQVTVTSTNDSFGCCARFIIDAAQWQISAQWSPGVYSWCFVCTNIVRSFDLEKMHAKKSTKMNFMN